MVDKLIQKKDEELIEVLKLADFTIDKFVYRWVNCFLTREFSMELVTWIWDTLLSEELDISTALGYVCAAMLLMMWDQIVSMQDTPEEIIMFIQNPPT